MHHHDGSRSLLKAGKFLFLASILALFTFALPLAGHAVDVTVVPVSTEETDVAADEEAIDPMAIQLPYREISEPGLKENILTELAGNTYYLLLDGKLLVAAPTQETLIQLVSDTVELYITENTIACSLAQPGQLELCYGHVSFGANYNHSRAAETLAESLLVSTTERIVEVVTVPAEQQIINDPTRYEDEGDIVVPGSDGLSQNTADITYINGSEDSRDVIISNVLVPMKSEIIYRPTQVRPEYIWPAEGRISSHFGHRNIGIGSSNHKGVDIAAYYGSDIVAAKAGTVIFSGRQGGYGKVVKIDHGDGSVTVYAHNSSLCVEEGDWVEQGDVIAKAGSTGTSSGTHCHFEIRIDDEAVDPELYLPVDESR